MTLEASFETGSLNVGASRIDGNLIQLTGRHGHMPGDRPGGWKWVHFELQGAKGQRPVFEINDQFESGPDRLKDHRMLFQSPDAAWQPFSDHHLADGKLHFGHDRPFATDVVRIAYGPTYSATRAMARVESLLTSGLAQPTPSADAQGIIGHAPAGVDETGRAVPALPLPGLRIGHGPKRVVLLSGVHPNEGPGGLMLEAALEALTIAPLALRDTATIDVYPMVNPAGRYAGLNRTTLQRMDVDANRAWHSDLYEDEPVVKTIAEAIIKDLDGDRPDWFIDCHAWTTATAPAFGILSQADGFDRDPFWTAFRDQLPELELMDSGWGNPSTETWAFKTLRARFCMTLEATFQLSPIGSFGYERAGQALAAALQHTLLDPSVN